MLARRRRCRWFAGPGEDVSCHMKLLPTDGGGCRARCTTMAAKAPVKSTFAVTEE